jgi:hypothetical protein
MRYKETATLRNRTVILNHFYNPITPDSPLAILLTAQLAIRTGPMKIAQTRDR